MANEYIERTNISNVDVITNQEQMCINYKNMLNNVTAMFNAEGPVMSTWIKFQMGLDEPIIFDNSSTDPKKNLIADLSFNKSCAGVTNDFTITIQYDPFNMGQEDTDIVEKLDQYVSNAMSVDFDTDLTTLRGTIQYGYNAVSDASLVSPEYTFYLTDANTTVKFESGISTYVFKGVSVLALDCDNVTKFEAITEETNLLEIVADTLYMWYGTKEHPPTHLSEKVKNGGDKYPYNNNFGYKIDINEEDYNDAVKVTVKAQNGMTPITYCQNLLDNNSLSQSEIDSGLYNDLSKLTYAQRPRYILYIDDANKTIRVNHIVPQYTNTNKTRLEKSKFSIDFPFYWGNQSQNIVTGWKPEVNTMLYLIRRARSERQGVLNEEYNNPETSEERKKTLQQQLVDINDDLNEMYDAQLQIIGIPADPPLGAEITVKPTIMQTVSRTAGVYIITGCEDAINNQGIYLTTLKLFRVRGIDDETVDMKDKADENQKAQDSDAKNQYTGGGGSSSGSGSTRSFGER